MNARAYFTAELFGGPYEVVDAVATASHLILVTKGTSLGMVQPKMQKVTKRRMLEKEEEENNHDFPIPGTMTNNKMTIAVFAMTSLTVEGDKPTPLLFKQFDVQVV